MDTRAVLDHHVKALEAGDLEATLDDYTEDSVLMMAGNVFKGLDALRGFFESKLQVELKPGSSSATVDSIDIAGEYALVTWRLRWEGGEYVFAADTYHVHDGKILLHTSAFLMRS